jgi:DNA gyrase inhibitor GyrI
VNSKRDGLVRIDAEENGERQERNAAIRHYSRSTAYIAYPANPEPGDFANQIRQVFQRLQTWVRALGYDPYTLLTIGVVKITDGRLSSYECCVQVPEEVQGGGSDEINFQDLPGGHYAVVAIEKDPVIIGDTIGCFYQEYVPQNHLQIDGARSTYEIYFQTTMEYCVPIL